MPTQTPLAIVGGGVMSQAIVRGGIDSSVLDLRRVAVVEPEPGKRDIFRAWGVRAVKTAEDLMTWLGGVETTSELGQILLAVKPQALPIVGQQFRPLLVGRHRVVMTILAGMPSGRVREALGGGGAPGPGQSLGVVRIMPNTPAQIRRGTTAIAAGAGTREGDAELAVELFSGLGRVVEIDEGLMDAFTAVGGTGPAYVFFLAEAMTRAAVEIGFDRDTAGWIVRWTIAGAGALLDGTDQPPEVLRAAVTSKGGTTAAAMTVLEEARVMDAFMRAVKAARDRGAELGRGE
jgi:pyrroline-5-carboxylate reductase